MSSTTGPAANGKKPGSGTSTAANTPSGTPVGSVTGISNGQSATQTTPPPNNNAPKYGTLVPNRIFVGGISANTTENELMQLFSNYGTVKAAKIIQDRAGVSKGYGFITFESEDDAKRLQRESDNIVLRERKLNIAPAIKKQQPPLQAYGRAFDGASPPAVAAGNPQYYFPGSIPFFQGNLYYPAPTAASGDPTAQQTQMYQAPTVYPAQSGPPQTSPYPPMLFPAQPMYVPQQYPMPMPYEYNYYPNGGPQYMVGGQQGGGNGNAGGQPQQVAAAAAAMQRPGSPPRQPCYGQQQQLPYPAAAAAVAAAAAADALYYNVPMYGTVDGAGPIYSDAVDMPNGTPLSEEYSVIIDPNNHHHHQQHHQHHHHHQQQQQQHHQPQHHQQHHNSIITSTTAAATSSPHQQQQQSSSTTPAATPDGVVVVSTEIVPYRRQSLVVDNQNQQQQQQNQPQGGGNVVSKSSSTGSGTPVVSLLSETHKVKDVTSMQSGRRRKSNVDVTNNGGQNSLIGTGSGGGIGSGGLTGSNGYNGYHHHHHHHHQGFFMQPQPINYASFNVPPFPFDNMGVGKYNGAQEKRFGGGRRRGNDRSSYGDRKSVDTSSLPRTESNSSASELADDNNKAIVGVDSTINVGGSSGVDGKNMTPPPAPYSPMTHSHYGSGSGNGSTGSGTTKFNNNNHHSTGSQSSSSFHYYNNHHHNYSNRNYNTRGSRGGGYSTGNRRSNYQNHHQNPHHHNQQHHQIESTTITSSSTSSSFSSGQQVHHVVGGSGQQQQQQHHQQQQTHFIPPVRRGRRSVRRNNTAPISEIGGAGDAPLPVAVVSDVSDACKKLEGLKL